MTDSALTPLLAHFCFSTVVSLPCPGFPVICFPGKEVEKDPQSQKYQEILNPKQGFPLTVETEVEWRGGR